MNKPRMSQPLRSTPITDASSLLQAGPPACPHRYSTPRSFCCPVHSLSPPPPPFRRRLEQYRHTPSHVSCSSRRSGSRRLHAGHRLASKRAPARLFPRICTYRRVARGISAPGPHRSGREPLDSSGSCHPVIRSCTATTSAQTGQVTVSGPPSAMPAPVHRYVPVACTSPSPTSSDGDPYAYLWASPQSDRTR